MKHKPLLAAAVISALGGAIWWQQGANSSAPVDTARGKRATSVELSPVSSAPASIRLSTNGNVTALDRLELRPQDSGVIAAIRVREGQQVAVGEVLVQLDAAAERAELAKARAALAANQAQLNIARRELARSQELKQQQFISQSALDTVQARVESLAANLAADRAQIDAVQVQLARKTLRAPVAGQVGAISLSPGALVQPAMAAPLLTITRVAPVAVSFYLAERQLPVVRQAQAQAPLTVYALNEADGSCHQGQLSFIDSAVDSSNGNVLLKAQFANAGKALWPGQFVRVTLDAGHYRDAVALPVAALITGPDGQFTYGVGKDNKVRRLPLTLLAVQDEQAIVRGVAPGAAVISSGGQNVRPGETVTVSRAKPRAAPAAQSESAASCPPVAANVGRKAEASAAAGVAP